VRETVRGEVVHRRGEFGVVGPLQAGEQRVSGQAEPVGEPGAQNAAVPRAAACNGR
jgi:hypothetical protein